MALKVTTRYDWGLLPLIVILGLLIGAAIGWAAAEFGPALSALLAEPHTKPF